MRRKPALAKAKRDLPHFAKLVAWPLMRWQEAGLEAITMHECRHTSASLLIDFGADPKAVQEVMGHSKIQTTFDPRHLFPGSHDEVRERMDAYLLSATSDCELVGTKGSGRPR